MNHDEIIQEKHIEHATDLTGQSGKAIDYEISIKKIQVREINNKRKGFKRMYGL